VLTDEQRQQLAALARQPRSRQLSEPSQGMPREWCPGVVASPESGLPLTEPGAWNLIADLLEGGHPVQEVVLSHPPGKTAYELLVDFEGAPSTLYIKIQFGAGKIVGRSFHYSTRSGHCGTRYKVTREDPT